MTSIHDNKTGTAAVLMIFCVFTASALTALTLGVSAYKNVTDITWENYEERICLSYIWTKIKNGDEADKVAVIDFHGRPALRIDETGDDGTIYHTIIFHHEGWVYELFFEDGLEFSPEDGVPIVNESLSFERLEDGLIKISAGAESVFVFPRGRAKIAYEAGGA